MDAAGFVLFVVDLLFFLFELANHVLPPDSFLHTLRQFLEQQISLNLLLLVDFLPVRFFLKFQQLAAGVQFF